jgi:hypothetical protein
MRCARPARLQHVYVWYRLAGDAACARAAITEMMLDVAAETGVAGRLFVRSDDPSTWMEVYEDIDDRIEFDHALAQSSAAHNVAAFADGGRHVEWFCPVATTVDI